MMTVRVPWLLLRSITLTISSASLRNVASEESFRQALYAALDIYRNRLRYQEATANPLRKQYFDRGGDNEKLDLTKDDDTDGL